MIALVLVCVAAAGAPSMAVLGLDGSAVPLDAFTQAALEEGAARRLGRTASRVVTAAEVRDRLGSAAVPRLRATLLDPTALVDEGLLAPAGGAQLVLVTELRPAAQGVSARWVLVDLRSGKVVADAARTVPVVAQLVRVQDAVLDTLVANTAPAARPAAPSASSSRGAGRPLVAGGVAGVLAGAATGTVGLVSLALSVVGVVGLQVYAVARLLPSQLLPAGPRFVARLGAPVMLGALAVVACAVAAGLTLAGVGALGFGLVRGI